MPISIDDLNKIRTIFLKCFDYLQKINSFKSLMDNNARLKSEIIGLGSEISKKVKMPFNDKMTVAIVGSSSHGKTTLMTEIFPGLNKRKWLVTDITDTTSQALRIQYQGLMDNQEYNDTIINSWTIDELKELIDSDNVKEKNLSDNIHVRYGDGFIEVDGTEGKFEAEVKNKFKFESIQRIKPFTVPYIIPKDKLDVGFIKAISTKQPSHEVDPSPLFSVEDTAYTSLHLRTIVKDISLTDDFNQIMSWLGVNGNNLTDKEKLIRTIAENIVFVDTPGLGVSGTQKDEILTHILRYKSHHIILNLLKNDELDIVIHVVLCGGKTDFSSVLEVLEKLSGSTYDLEDRIVLAINGMNLLFGKDSSAHIEKGDHFQMILKENILERLHLKRKVTPAKICFVDSKSHVEHHMRSVSKQHGYSDFYDDKKNEMESWLEPSSKPHTYLAELGIVESFRENIKSLVNPSDCGQGFMIRQLVDLIQTKRDVLLLKKYFIRTGLLQQCKQLVDILNRYYDEQGKLTRAATLEAVRGCFSFLKQDRLEGIDDFCKEHLDSSIEVIIKRCTHHEKWLVDAFSGACNLLRDAIIKESKVDQNIQVTLNGYFELMTSQWVENWGYSDAHLPVPNDPHTIGIAVHSIKIHLREILFISMTTIENTVDTQQTEDDIQSVRKIIFNLKKTYRDAENLCKKEGIAL